MKIKELEAELANRQQLIRELDAIIDSVTDGIYITDGNGITLRTNKAFEEITGIKSSETKGKTVDELVETGVYNKSVSTLVLESRCTTSVAETLPNGKEVILTGTPIFDEGGNITRVVTTLRDMADLKNLETRLAQTEKRNELYRMEVLNLRLQQMKMEHVIISSQQMKDIMKFALRLGEVDSTVLITGESGVGKEIISRAIHNAGTSVNKPLITAVCSAIPENLLESELFGYEKGSFTGADRGGKQGLFEVAEGGTLFLDEIGDISLNLQVKLLRAIQEKEITRIGGRKPIKINVRIISATNKNLKKMVQEGTFRQDLYYRLNVVPIHIPPLRERRDDIIPLINHFIDVFNLKFNKQLRFSPEALVLLEAYDWPGNTRELENTIERIAVLSSGKLITRDDLSDYIKEEIIIKPDGISMQIQPLTEAVEALEKKLISNAWQKHRYTRKMAAALKISQSTIVRKMKYYGIGDQADS